MTRLASRRCCSSACGIATLAKFDPVGEEQVVGADRALLVVALLALPGRVALPRVDHRAREVVGEGGGLARRPRRRCAASPPGSAWACRRRSAASRRSVAPQAVKRFAVPWNWIVSPVIPAPGRRAGVHLQVGVGQRAAAGAVTPSRPASLASGRMAIRLPPPLTHVLEHRRLRVGERGLGEDHDAVGRRAWWR